jgi:hypothetical protein
MQEHIPAWKRIGLKLKYAKDSSHQDNLSPESEITRASNGKPYEITETTNLGHASPPKKRKLSPGSTARHTEVARPFETRPPKRDAVNKSIVAGHNEETNAEQPTR